MPKTSEYVLRTTAEMVASRLRQVVAKDQALSPETVRQVIVEARKTNSRVPNLQSPRSLERVAEIFMERFT